MRDSVHNVILKVLAVLLGLGGLVDLIGGFELPGAFLKITSVVFGLFYLWVAVAFWMRRGWAFLVVSVLLLLRFLAGIVMFILSIDRGEGVGQHALSLVMTIALIAYVGRWSIERRFRPHLDAAPHH